MLSWFLQPDQHPNVQVFAEEHPPFVENVFGSIYKATNPCEELKRCLRYLLELDEPCLNPPSSSVRVWAVRHEPSDPITEDWLYTQQPTAHYARAYGPLTLVAGVDILSL